ncbi:hypothetical protein L6164_006949 [Bauhinia variegata]|uniref:Uncharacterized protein n=1 Tax=Bauhinia variegata TaxID=167791 RepID=A0ACB9PW52_BAUVA|nr:hypothetical protein L6164_006949 [Bauhinia variegata]
MGEGEPSPSQMLNNVTATLYNQFVDTSSQMLSTAIKKLFKQVAEESSKLLLVVIMTMLNVVIRNLYNQTVNASRKLSDASRKLSDTWKWSDTSRKWSNASQMLISVAGTLYSQYVEKDINDFDSFHIAVLHIFNAINTAMPGKHYDAPSYKEVEELFRIWQAETEEERRKKFFTEFMRKNVNPSITMYDFTTILGMVAPLVAMVVKRGGETLPLLKFLKDIPDVVFVPTATALALMLSKQKFHLGSENGSARIL